MPSGWPSSTMRSSPMRPRLLARTWFFLVVVGVFAASPWLIGNALAPAGWDHLPTFVMAAGDTPVYFRYIDEGRNGGPFMIDGLTTEEHPAILWQPLWWLLGRVAELTGTSSPTAFAIGRILGAVLLAWTIVWAARQLYQDRATQVVARWIGFFGAGLGGLLFFILGPWILSELRVYDLWVSEGYAWMSAMASPHFLVVSSGLLFVFIGTEFGAFRASFRPWLGPVLLLTSSIHPFHLPTLFSVWFAMSVFDRFWRPSEAKARLIQRLWNALWTVPTLIYYGLTFNQPIVSERAAQNINLTSLWPLALGIAPIFILAAMTFLRRTSRALWTLALWVAAIFVLVFFPFEFQRRLFEPPAVLLGLLAAPTITRWLQGGPWSFLGGAATIALMLLSPIAVYGKQINHILSDRRSVATTLAYVQPAMKHIIRSVRDQGEPATILAGQVNSLILGAFTPLRPYFAHGVETVDAFRKRDEVKEFYSTMNVTEHVRFVRERGICYIVHSPYERQYGPAFPGIGWPGLRRVLDLDGYQLYDTGVCARRASTTSN